MIAIEPRIDGERSFKRGARGADVPSILLDDAGAKPHPRILGTGRDRLGVGLTRSGKISLTVQRPGEGRPRRVILAQFVVGAAFAVRTMRTTFDHLPQRPEDVARVLGCSRAHAVLRVT